MLILVGFVVVDGLVGRILPTSFLPEEDYGYACLNVQLPAAASLDRTDQVLRKVEGILAKTEGVQYYTTVGGFSLLNRISASYQGFFFIGFKPWDERTSSELKARSIVDKVNGELASQVPEAMAFAFMPPSFPGSAAQAVFRSGSRIGAAGPSNSSTRICRDSSPQQASVRSWQESLRSFPLQYRKSSQMWIATRP